MTKAGRPVTLEPKAFDVLLHLLDNRGVLVGKAHYSSSSGRKPSSPRTILPMP